MLAPAGEVLAGCSHTASGEPGFPHHCTPWLSRDPTRPRWTSSSALSDTDAEQTLSKAADVMRHSGAFIRVTARAPQLPGGH